MGFSVVSHYLVGKDKQDKHPLVSVDLLALLLTLLGAWLPAHISEIPIPIISVISPPACGLKMSIKIAARAAWLIASLVWRSTAFRAPHS